MSWARSYNVNSLRTRRKLRRSSGLVSSGKRPSRCGIESSLCGGWSRSRCSRCCRSRLLGDLLGCCLLGSRLLSSRLLHRRLLCRCRLLGRCHLLRWRGLLGCSLLRRCRLLGRSGLLRCRLLGRCSLLRSRLLGRCSLLGRSGLLRRGGLLRGGLLGRSGLFRSCHNDLLDQVANGTGPQLRVRRFIVRWSVFGLLPVDGRLGATNGTASSA